MILCWNLKPKITESPVREIESPNAERQNWLKLKKSEPNIKNSKKI
jgi:hypothetical protein